MPVGLFLGAGCPLSIRVPSGDGEDTRPLIPDVQGLTSEVCDELAKSKESDGPLSEIRAQLDADGKRRGNIEDILSHVRALQHAAGTGEVRGLSASQLSQLDDAICKVIYSRVHVRLPSRDTSYHRMASWMGAIERGHPMEVFTPNYDLLIEQSLEESGVPYFDGFVGSDRTFFDPPSMELDELPARWARLWKLHGSINWRQDKNGTVSRGESFEGYERRLIHPSHLKFDESRRMPYLAMIDRLRAFLRRSPAVLVVCGYSFSDQHLNEVLLQGLQGNPSAICFALLYSRLEKHPKAAALAERRANLSLLARDGAVIGTRMGLWKVRDEFDGARQPTAVRFTAGSEGGDSTCEFQLGDFARFAEFLSDQIGAAHVATRGTDAR